MSETNLLQLAREGRSAARHLDQLVATHTLTEDDAKRLVAKIKAGFDAVLSQERPDENPEFHLTAAGRAALRWGQHRREPRL